MTPPLVVGALRRHDRPVRIGDRERRRAERRLRASYLRGELSADTFEGRLGAAFSARHAGELAPLADDLPTPLDRIRSALARLRGSSAPDLILPGMEPGACLLLGRARVADLRFADLSVSRRHAELRRVGNGWLLVDCGSCNGTYVNGVRVERAHVGDGDEIRLGGTAVVLRAPM
jgi:hypothetical protein